MFKQIKSKAEQLFRGIKIKYFRSIFIYKSNLGFDIILDMEKNVDRNFYLNCFEIENFILLKKKIKSGMIVFDIGANIGLYTLLFSKKVESEGRVFSFEPSPEAYFRLKQNVVLNKINNVKLYNMGISDKTGNSEFFICEDDAYNSLGKKPMMPIVKTIDVPITTIDEFCLKEKINKVDLIKIDTEGAEFLVLKGAEKLLTSDNAPILICEYNRLTEEGYDYKITDLYDYLVKIGYLIYEIKKGTLYKFDVIRSSASDLICIKEFHKSMFRIHRNFIS